MKQFVQCSASCYNSPIKKGGEAMASNSERLNRYMEKLTTIKVRFPSPESCGNDYLQMMRDRAQELGYITTVGKNKGEGSVNSYILHLIEQDLGTDMAKGMNQIDK